LDRAVNHYVTEAAPRRLPLTPKDRAYCLLATKHTTHPSALLPAFIFADANLRGTSHPNFVRWSRSNANAARVLCLRIIGVLLVVLGLALDMVLVLSRLSPFLRVLCLALWWPGFTVLFAAATRLCVALHFLHQRQLRPWELDLPLTGPEITARKDVDIESDVDDFTGVRTSFTTVITAGNNSKQSQNGAGATIEARGTAQAMASGPGSESRKEDGEAVMTTTTSGGWWRQHARKDTGSSSLASPHLGADPLRKPSLQMFGPANESAGSPWPWTQLYAQRPFLSRVFDAAVPVQNRALSGMHDRTLFLAVVWAGLVASLLTVGSLFIPKAGLMF
jgi:hypothetical protein